MRWIALPVVILLVALFWFEQDRRSTTSPDTEGKRSAAAPTPEAIASSKDSMNNTNQDPDMPKNWDGRTRIEKSDAEWRKEMTDFEFEVMRNKGTERAFTGEYWDHKEPGTYHCRGCGLALFRSDAKYDSGCGWPSFFEPLEGAHIEEHRDTSYGMIRTEVTCKRCGAHLGHVFKDGPAPTGLRYCINSVSIDHEPKEADKKAPPAEAKPAAPEKKK